MGGREACGERAGRNIRVGPRNPSSALLSGAAPTTDGEHHASSAAGRRRRSLCCCRAGGVLAHVCLAAGDLIGDRRGDVVVQASVGQTLLHGKVKSIIVGAVVFAAGSRDDGRERRYAACPSTAYSHQTVSRAEGGVAGAACIGRSTAAEELVRCWVEVGRSGIRIAPWAMVDAALPAF